MKTKSMRNLVGILYQNRYLTSKKEWLRFRRNEQRKIKEHMEGVSKFKVVRQMDFDRLEILLNDYDATTQTNPQ